MKYLIFDISNVLYRTFFANKNYSLEDSSGLAHHMALMSMHKFYRQFQPNVVVMAFDRPSWRKQYTLSENCISGKKYKGNRRQKMTPAEKAKFEEFINHVNEFEQIMKEHTRCMCLANDGLEADDLIAGMVEAYGVRTENEIIIVSRDRDLAQMLGEGKDILYPNVIQHDPFTGEQITIKTAIKDLFKEKKKSTIPNNLLQTDFFLYAKKFRGDAGDNVQSAYPGIRKTRIISAYNDPFEHTKVMNHTWTDENRNTFKVEDLFNEGDLLMNLRHQPNDIRAKIFQTILDGEECGDFSYFHFMKYLGKHQLSKLAQNLDQVLPMLS